jgi:large subunit ribosomal protein L29
MNNISRAEELRNKSSVELQAEMQTLLREQFKCKIAASSGEFKQNHIFKKLRRDVARIETIITESKKGKV